jgi:hypothetical protein
MAKIKETEPKTCGFISIKMVKIVVDSPSLTQPHLLYPDLGPVMLEPTILSRPTNRDSISRPYRFLKNDLLTRYDLGDLITSRPTNRTT